MGCLLVPASVGAHRYVQDDVRTLPVPPCAEGCARPNIPLFHLGYMRLEFVSCVSGIYVPRVSFIFVVLVLGYMCPETFLSEEDNARDICARTCKLTCVNSTFVLPALPREFAELSDLPAGLPYL